MLDLVPRFLRYTIYYGATSIIRNTRPICQPRMHTPKVPAPSSVCVVQSDKILTSRHCILEAGSATRLDHVDHHGRCRWRTTRVWFLRPWRLRTRTTSPSSSACTGGCSSERPPAVERGQEFSVPATSCSLCAPLARRPVRQQSGVCWLPWALDILSHLRTREGCRQLQPDSSFRRTQLERTSEAV